MKSGLRQALYGLGAAIFLVLGALGFVTDDVRETWLTVLDNILEVAFSLAFVLAAKNVNKPTDDVTVQRSKSQF